MALMRRIGAGSGLMFLATVLGVMTAGAAFVWLDSQREEAAVEASSLRSDVMIASVAIARTSVPAGVELTAGMVELRELPAAAVLPGALTSLDDVLRRVTRYPLVEGEQILPSRLVTSETAQGTGLAFSVPAGMRALSVPVSEVSGAGGLIVPGDRVDVLVSTRYKYLFAPFELRMSEDASDAGEHPTVITILQDVLVLAVGQQTTPPADAQRDPATLRPEDARVQPQASSATLAVLPEQAQLLFMASQQGTLGLSLRSFGANDTEPLDPLLRLEPVLTMGRVAIAP